MEGESGSDTLGGSFQLHVDIIPSNDSLFVDISGTNVGLFTGRLDSGVVTVTTISEWAIR